MSAVERALERIQKFVFLISREGWSPASFSSTALTFLATALYAFKADFLSMATALLVAFAVGFRRWSSVASTVAFVFIFTAWVYAFGYVVSGRTAPWETFYRALASAAVLSGYMAARGFTPVALSLSCIGLGPTLFTILKTVLMSPTALREGFLAAKALRGKEDLTIASYAYVLFLKRLERKYLDISMVAHLINYPCRKKPDMYILYPALLIAIWLLF
ncbi:hypothetical protein [Pyrobaculum calidifontis]|nr:hypothetical protein [Pyrobaculum calidifontis]